MEDDGKRNALTIEDILADGLKKIEGGSIRPITVPYFVMNMAAFMLVLMSFDSLLMGPEPDDRVKKYIDIFTQNDLMRGMRLYIQVSGFLEWLLDAEYKEEEFGEAFSIEWITDKWNEFVRWQA